MREWLREMRKAKGLSQLAAAELAGISRNYYAMIEAGERGSLLPVKTAKKVAAVLGFDWMRFYGEEATAKGCEVTMANSELTTGGINLSGSLTCPRYPTEPTAERKLKEMEAEALVLRSRLASLKEAAALAIRDLYGTRTKVGAGNDLAIWAAAKAGAMTEAYATMAGIGYDAAAADLRGDEKQGG